MNNTERLSRDFFQKLIAAHATIAGEIAARRYGKVDCDSLRAKVDMLHEFEESIGASSTALRRGRALVEFIDLDQSNPAAAALLIEEKGVLDCGWAGPHWFKLLPDGPQAIRAGDAN